MKALFAGDLVKVKQPGPEFFAGIRSRRRFSDRHAYHAIESGARRVLPSGRVYVVGKRGEWRRFK